MLPIERKNEIINKGKVNFKRETPEAKIEVNSFLAYKSLNVYEVANKIAIGIENDIALGIYKNSTLKISIGGIC